MAQQCGTKKLADTSSGFGKESLCGPVSRWRNPCLSAGKAWPNAALTVLTGWVEEASRKFLLNFPVSASGFRKENHCSPNLILKILG